MSRTRYWLRRGAAITPPPPEGAPNFRVDTAPAVALRAALTGLTRLAAAVRLTIAPLTAVVPTKPALALANATSGTAKAVVNAAVRLANATTGTAKATVNAALALATAPVTALMPTKPAMMLMNQTSGVAVKPNVRAAPRLTNATNGTAHPPNTPALDIVQTTVDLTRKVGANATIEEAVGGRTDWANDANAQGLKNGANATLVGNALAARGGKLVVQYANAVNKMPLTVSAVALRFYHQLADVLLASGDQQIGWRKAGSADQTLQSFTDNVNNLANGINFNLTVGWGDTPAANTITSWADLDAVEAFCRAECALGETHNHRLDAVELTIVAASTVAQ